MYACACHGEFAGDGCEGDPGFSGWMVGGTDSGVAGGIAGGTGCGNAGGMMGMSGTARGDGRGAACRDEAAKDRSERTLAQGDGEAEQVAEAECEGDEQQDMGSGSQPTTSP